MYDELRQQTAWVKICALVDKYPQKEELLNAMLEWQNATISLAMAKPARLVVRHEYDPGPDPMMSW